MAVGKAEHTPAPGLINSPQRALRAPVVHKPHIPGDSFESKAVTQASPTTPPLLAFNEKDLKTTKEWRSLVVNGYMYSTLAMCGISQCLHAARAVILNYGLVTAAAQGNPGLVAICVGTYFGLWVAAEMTRYISLYLRILWRQHAFLSFEKYMAEINRHHVINWAMEQHAKDLVSWISNQGPDGIDGYILMLYGSANFMFSLLVNTIVLSQIVTPMLIPVFIVIAIALVGYVYWTNGRRKDETINDQQMRRQFNKILTAMPENVQLPNPYNNALWRLAYVKQEEDSTKAICVLAQSSLLDSLAVLLFSSIPSAALLTYNALQSIKSAQETLNYAVNTVNVLTQFNGMMEVITSWVRSECKIQNVFKQEDNDPANLAKKWQDRIDTLLRNIDFNKFDMKHNGVSVSLADIVKDPDAILSKPGRFVITAPNGSGKSTLLVAMLLYYAGKREIAYIPPKNSLRFQNPCEGSSGEVTCEQIREMCEKAKDLSMLLVDEWDAYLDPDNTDKIDGVLEAFSKDHTLIEVRQRRKPR